MVLKTSLPIFEEIVPFSISWIILPRRFASTGESLISFPSEFRFFDRSPIIQLAASFGSAPSATTASKYSAISRDEVMMPAS